ncbi:hypothetical protein LUU34_00119400 [Aix galericulata]|nr:hypothetical protein LUU34_00119400 [Aix galericulata]
MPCSVPTAPLPSPINARFFLPQEAPGPALGPGSPQAPSRPPAAPILPIAALQDPPPAQEPPAEHELHPRRIPSHF